MSPFDRLLSVSADTADGAPCEAPVTKYSYVVAPEALKLTVSPAQIVRSASDWITATTGLGATSTIKVSAAIEWQPSAE
ncbi:hypothetical protein SDC9_58697 [bioreactor metagenome]|uniref:Uncharacterized protein n=1 Tax=bioreactor metagenome TaxID=1076179 RepID=A0A644XDR8_9ZZZZ